MCRLPSVDFSLPSSTLTLQLASLHKASCVSPRLPVFRFLRITSIVTHLLRCCQYPPGWCTQHVPEKLPRNMPESSPDCETLSTITHPGRSLSGLRYEHDHVLQHRKPDSIHINVAGQLPSSRKHWQTAWITFSSRLLQC